MYVALFLHATACSKGSKVALGRNFIGIWVHRPACTWHGMCLYSFYSTSFSSFNVWISYRAMCITMSHSILVWIRYGEFSWWATVIASFYIKERNLVPCGPAKHKFHFASYHRLKATFHSGYSLKWARCKSGRPWNIMHCMPCSTLRRSSSIQTTLVPEALTL